MTLIVSGKFTSGVVIQADGRSNFNGSIKDDCLQKIFPIACSLIAVSHSGINEFKSSSAIAHLSSDGDQLKICVADALLSLDLRNLCSHMDVAVCLIEKLGPLIARSWCSCNDCKTKNEDTCFIIDGFDAFKCPQRIRLAWDYGSVLPRIQSQPEWGWAYGTGASVKWPKLPPNPIGTIQHWAEVVDGIHSDAMKRAGDCCGGHIHSLVITP